MPAYNLLRAEFPQSEKQSDLRARMQEWDDILWEKSDIEIDEGPQAILDSLESINFKSLNYKKTGHIMLLQTIARDKSYYVFENDSVISIAVKWYKNKPTRTITAGVCFTTPLYFLRFIPTIL